MQGSKLHQACNATTEMSSKVTVTFFHHLTWLDEGLLLPRLYYRGRNQFLKLKSNRSARKHHTTYSLPISPHFQLLIQKKRSIFMIKWIMKWIIWGIKWIIRRLWSVKWSDHIQNKSLKTRSFWTECTTRPVILDNEKECTLLEFKDIKMCLCVNKETCHLQPAFSVTNHIPDTVDLFKNGNHIEINDLSPDVVLIIFT